MADTNDNLHRTMWQDNKFDSVLADLKELSKDEVFLDDRFGELKFEYEYDAFKEVITLLDAFLEIMRGEVEFLDTGTLRGLEQNLMSVVGCGAQIKSFNMRHPNSSEYRQTISAELFVKSVEISKKINDLSRNAAIKKIAIKLREATSMSYLNDVKENLEKSLGQARDLYNEFNDKQSEMDNLLNIAKEMTASKGFEVYTELYKNAETGHKDSAEKWMKAALGFLSGTVAIIMIGTYFSFELAKDNSLDNAFLWQYTATKLFLSFLFISCTLWCARMYKIEKNMSLINLEKQYSLKTFKAFHASAEEQNIKDVVLMEAARSIFSSNSSGLVDVNQNDESTKIVEVFRSFVPNTAQKA